MILIFHVLIALGTVIGAVYVAVRPTAKRRNLVNIGIAVTVVSGMTLVAISPDVLAHACVSGIITVVATMALRAVARRRMLMDSRI